MQCVDTAFAAAGGRPSRMVDERNGFRLDAEASAQTIENRLRGPLKQHSVFTHAIRGDPVAQRHLL